MGGNDNCHRASQGGRGRQKSAKKTITYFVYGPLNKITFLLQPPLQVKQEVACEYSSPHLHKVYMRVRVRAAISQAKQEGTILSNTI